MKLIKYYRFVTEPDTLKVAYVTPLKMSTMFYHIELDHEEVIESENDALSRARKFLKDHFGKVVIQDDVDTIKLCNHRKMWYTFLKDNVILSQHTVIEE